MVKKKAIQKTSKASLDTMARSETPLYPIAWMTTAIERAGQTKTYCASGTLPQQRISERKLLAQSGAMAATSATD